MNNKRLALNYFGMGFILLFFVMPAYAKSEGEMLEKMYKLDAIVGSGVCPEELKPSRQYNELDFGCDRVKIEYGNPSKEYARCRMRKNLANRIAHEYNLFIESCKNNKVE